MMSFSEEMMKSLKVILGGIILILASLFFLGLCILSRPDSSGPEGIALALFVLGLIVSSFGLFFVKEG